MRAGFGGVLAAWLLGLWGCDGGSSGILACRYTVADGGGGGLSDGSLCVEYAGEVRPTECPPGGSYVEVDACAIEGRVGRCELTTGTTEGAVVSVAYFYAPSHDAGIARSTCMSIGGTFAER